MKFIPLFETLTRATLKDCFEFNERIYFVVNEKQIGKAIGKQGKNIKLLEKTINRKIKIIEFNPHIVQFINNLIYPLKVKDIEQQDDSIVITGGDTKTKGLLIGRNSQNLKRTEKIVKRYFKIDNIKII